MAVPKAEIVSTQAPYEPDAQAMSSLAEKTPPEDQRSLFIALEALERLGTDVSQVPANWEETIQRIRHIPREQHDERTRCISAIRNALKPPCEAASSIPENLFDRLSAQTTYDLISMLPPQGQASLAQTSRAMRKAVRDYRAQLVAPFLNESGLERLLTYFCPQSLSSNRIGAFESLNQDLLTKVVPDILEVLEESTNISGDEKKTLCQHSPKTIVGNPNLLFQVLQAAYDNSLVSIIAGVSNPRPPLPDFQTMPTLAKKALATREWLKVNGPSVGAIYLLEGHYATCLPEEICTLTSLSLLAVRGQPIRIIPHSIRNLCSLTLLYLENSQVIALPSEIGTLIGLIRLLLKGNRISTLPSEMGTLKKLARLELNRNRLTALPSEIGDLGDLTWLEIDQNQLTALPSEMGTLKNLAHLSLDHNQLTVLSSEIGTLSKLTWLVLKNNPLTELSQQYFKSLAKNDPRLCFMV